MIAKIRSLPRRSPQHQPEPYASPDAVSTDPTYCLVSYSCGHYLIVQGSASEININQLPEVSEVTALNDLKRLPTHKHIALPRRCARDTCAASSSWSSWKPRTLRYVVDLTEVLKALANQYYMLGFKYHKIPFSRRVRFAGRVDCALAHEQYAISSTPREQDPFFEPWLLAQEFVGYSKDLLTADSALSEVREACLELNSARQLIGILVRQLRELEVAVSMMESCVARDESAEAYDDLPTKGNFAALQAKSRWRTRTV